MISIEAYHIFHSNEIHKMKCTYDISFLKLAHVLNDGDVESNPGHVPLEAHRASIGRFYNKGKHLSYIEAFNTNMSCFFTAYLNYLVLHFNKNFGLSLWNFMTLVSLSVSNY